MYILTAKLPVISVVVRVSYSKSRGNIYEVSMAKVIIFASSPEPVLLMAQSEVIIE